MTPTSRSWSRVLWPLGALACFLWLYALAEHAGDLAVNSDLATVVLQGKSMASGNVLLHGWVLSYDSWWSLDTLFYAVATAVAGVVPVLMFVVPTVIAALTVVVCVVMARQGRRGAAAAAGAVTVAVLLVLPAHGMVVDFLCGPHVSTALYALVAFLGLQRNRFGWGWALAVTLFTAGMLGDLQMVAYGVGPALAAGCLAMLRRRSVRAGTVAVTAAGASVLLALVVRKVVVALGTFTIAPANPRASLSEMVANLRFVLTGLAQLLGVRNTAFGTGGVPAALQAVHLAVALLLAVGFAVTVARLLRDVIGRPGRAGATPPPPGAANDAGDAGDAEPWRLDDLLLMATLAACATYILLATNGSASYVRYLTPAVIFLSALAGRVVAGWWAGDRAVSVRKAVTGIAAAVTACLAVAAGFQLHQPATISPAVGLSRFLEAHQLTLGIGDYWSSSITTVESDGSVQVRPVVVSPEGTLVAHEKGPVHAWFSHVRFQFMVFTAPVGYADAGLQTATATWGTPAHSYVVGPYDVLVWSHPITVTGEENLHGNSP